MWKKVQGGVPDGSVMGQIVTSIRKNMLIIYYPFIFYPFPNEKNLKYSNLHTFSEKIPEPHIIDRNKQLFESYGNLVESALLNFRIDITHNSNTLS